jgi:hypothetical protein
MFDSLFIGLSVPEMRTLYRKLAHKYHPDKGGDTKKMQELNDTYWQALKNAEKANLDPDQEFDWKHEKDLMDKIQKVVNLEGLEVEVLGLWVWVTGNTYPHKDTLKASGFFYSKAKQAWYFRKKEDTKRFYRGDSTLDEIRTKYKAQKVRANRKLTLA